MKVNLLGDFLKGIMLGLWYSYVIALFWILLIMGIMMILEPILVIFFDMEVGK